MGILDGSNLDKKLVVSIRYDGINIDKVLRSFPTMCATFPMIYRVPPLLVHHLRKADF